MKIEGFQLVPQGVEVIGTQGKFLIQGWNENIIRCVFTKKSEFDTCSPLTIMQGECTKLKVIQSDLLLSIATPKILLEINKATGIFLWKDALTKEVVLQEAGKELIEVPVHKYTTNGEKPIIKRVKTVDGERNFVQNLMPVLDRMAYRGKLFFNWQEGEAIHGLGQAEEGIYNYRGENQYLYQHNMRIPIPFLVSDKNYGILMDCGSLMTFNDDSRGSYLFLDTIEQIDYYFIYGSKLDEVVGGFRELTGDAAMLPKWCFGYVQSKEAYHTQQEMVDVVKKYRERKIPLDCIVQDWNTWADGEWGNKIVDKKRYPDLSSAMNEIHKMNVHTMVSVWPNMNSGTENYEEFLEEGYLLNDLATYDAFQEKARKIYWKQANEELFSGGFDSWWCDSTEPFSGPDWNGEKTREPWERYQLVGTEHKKYLDPAKANLYASVHAKGIYENQRKHNPRKRVLNLTRSGYAASQRYGTVLWSGDTCATWGNFKKQITEGLNFCMSGMPYWTLDIGAFFTVHEEWQNRGCNCENDPTPKWFWQGDYENGVSDYAYRELYVRWLQYGTFLPMFRSHGTDTPREIWNFGEPGEMFYDAIEKFIKLRYQLMPYIYSMAGRVTQERYTMLRSLLFDFNEDITAKNMDSEFMFGDSLLICPVTKPMYYEPENKELESVKTWPCYLPAGNKWYDFWTHEAYEGGTWITADAALDKIPVFVKAGSVIPMEKELQYASQNADTPLEIHIFEGCDAAFTLYEDGGDDYDYENGVYNTISIQWDDSNKVLKLGRAAYDFEQTIKNRVCKVIAGTKTAEFLYEGKPVEIQV